MIKFSKKKVERKKAHYCAFILVDLLVCNECYPAGKLRSAELIRSTRNPNWSEWQDSNLRHLAPKASGITRLTYTPFLIYENLQSDTLNLSQEEGTHPFLSSGSPATPLPPDLFDKQAPNFAYVAIITQNYHSSNMVYLFKSFGLLFQ